MKKTTLLLSLILTASVASASGKDNIFTRLLGNRQATQTSVAKTERQKSDSIYESVKQLYTQGKISADSVAGLAKYHKQWSPTTAERCLKMVADKSKRGAMELGVLYAFTPAFAAQASEGVKLLQEAAAAGNNDANCYLGLYCFNHGDYAGAKKYLDACRPMDYGVGYTALGSMYLAGNGVKEDLGKARENFRHAALKGYPRGMALYGFNLRASEAGKVSYPDSFFWLYMAGDLGDDAARTTLYLPRRNEYRGDSETAKDALTALQYIEMAQSGKKIQNEPIYKDGFLPSLKAREKAAEQGDDWARFYLGSMNYNGEFLNQNFAQALRYYEPIAKNAKLPDTVLALVNERLARIYREGKGTKADPAKAAQYAKAAAAYGSLPAYKIVEGISE